MTELLAVLFVLALQVVLAAFWPSGAGVLVSWVGLRVRDLFTGDRDLEVVLALVVGVTLAGCAETTLAPDPELPVVVAGPPPLEELETEGVTILAPFTELPAPAGLVPEFVFQVGDEEALSLDGFDLGGVKRLISFAVPVGKPFVVSTSVEIVETDRGLASMHCMYGPQYAWGSPEILRAVAEEPVVSFVVWAGVPAMAPYAPTVRHCPLLLDVGDGLGGFESLVRFDVRALR